MGNIINNKVKAIEEENLNFEDINNKFTDIEIVKKEIERNKKTMGLASRYLFDDRIIDNILKIKEKFDEIGIETDLKTDFLGKSNFEPDIVTSETNTPDKIPVTQEIDSTICIGKFTYHYNVIGGYNKYFWSCCGDESKNHDPFEMHPLEIKVYLQSLNNKIYNTI
jgi:hypothetical protein